MDKSQTDTLDYFQKRRADKLLERKLRQKQT